MTSCPFFLQMKLFDIQDNHLLLDNTLVLNCPQPFNLSFSLPNTQTSTPHLHQYQVQLIYTSNILSFHLFHVFHPEASTRAHLIYKKTLVHSKNNFVCGVLKKCDGEDGSNSNNCVSFQARNKSLVIGNVDTSLPPAWIIFISTWIYLFLLLLSFFLIVLSLLLAKFLKKKNLLKGNRASKKNKKNDSKRSKVIFRNCHKLLFCRNHKTHLIVSKNPKIAFVCSLYLFLFIRILILLSLTYTFGFFLFVIHVQPEMNEIFQNMASLFSVRGSQHKHQLAIINSQTSISTQEIENFINSINSFYSRKYNSIYIYLKSKILTAYRFNEKTSNVSYMSRNLLRFQSSYESDIDRSSHVFKELYVNTTRMHLRNYVLYLRMVRKSMWLVRAKRLYELVENDYETQAEETGLINFLGVQEATEIFNKKDNLFKKYYICFLFVLCLLVCMENEVDTQNKYLL